MNDKIKIKTGDLELIDSKTFFPLNDADTIIDLSTPEGNATFVINFKNSEKDLEKLNKVSQVINETTLRLTFTNYNQTLGSYNVSPWKVGNLNNRPIFVIYTIFGLNKAEFKRMDLAFYIGKGENNG